MKLKIALILFVLGLQISVKAQPANDNCSGAILLLPNNTCISVSGTVSQATDSGIPATVSGGCGSTWPDDDVWYYFQATGISHTLKLTGTGMQPAIEVFNSSSAGMASCIGSSINCSAVAAIGATASLSIATISGNYYYVRVYCYNGGSSTTTGLFDLCLLNPPPPNDNCSGAISLFPSSTCNPTAGNVTLATQSLPANVLCSDAASANDDIWYKFVATCSAHTITVESSGGFDAVFEVYGVACGATSLGCINATGAGGTENAMVTNLTVGTTYWVRVFDSGNGAPATTDFTICIKDCTSVDITENSNETEISIYPNPATDGLFISSKKQLIISLRVLNLLGEEIINQTINTNDKFIDISNYSKGIYFVEVKTEAELVRKKLVKQ